MDSTNATFRSIDHKFDSEGDLVFAVGSESEEGQRNFLVCSATMRRSSPVWKRMLFGPWAETKPGRGEWVVALPEDKPSPVVVLLDILHGNFEDLPTEQILNRCAFSFVSDILVVTDKYDLIRFLRPWASRWVEVAKGDWQPWYSRHHIWQRLHVPWEMGSKTHLSAVISQIVLNSSENDMQNLLDYNENASSQGLPSVLHDILDAVATCRLDLIQELLDFFHELVGRRAPSKLAEGACIKFQRSPDERRRCDSLALGEISRYLISSGTQIPKQACEVDMSLNKLLYTMRAMCNIDHLCLRGHRHCSPSSELAAFEHHLVNDDRRWHRVLNDSQHERMYQRRKLLEIWDDN